MITGADEIGITLVTEGVGPTVIWNSGTWRYMYLQSNGNGGKVLYEFLRSYGEVAPKCKSFHSHGFTLRTTVHLNEYPLGDLFLRVRVCTLLLYKILL